MERLLARLHAGEINLLVGTQMIAKGHDIHGVTLVGVVGADFALGLPGLPRRRAHLSSSLPRSPAAPAAVTYPARSSSRPTTPTTTPFNSPLSTTTPASWRKSFSTAGGCTTRRFAVLANIIIQSPKLEEATSWSATLGKWFERTRLDKVRVLGPAAAPISRIKRIYRFHFVLKAEQRKTLSRTLRAMLTFADTHEIPRRNLIVDVDAVHLM